MTNTNDSFIDEVSEAVRRDRLTLWFRRWGWMIVLAAVLVVAAAGWIEWRQAQARAVAELRGEVLLTALEVPDPEARAAALSELPADGEEALVGRLLLAAEQADGDDPSQAEATYRAIADDAGVPDLYRQMALLKASMLAVADGDVQDADLASLEGLAAPGAPFRLLALETIATARIAAGDTEAAIEALQTIRDDAETGEAQRQRAGALLIALGVPPDVEAPASSAEPVADQ